MQCDLLATGDYFAQKAGGHEIKGLKAFMKTRTRGLHTSLMVLVDYAGYRVIASTVLPLAKDSLGQLSWLVSVCPLLLLIASDWCCLSVMGLS